MPLTYDILIDRNAPKDLIFSYSSNNVLRIGDYVAVLLKGHLAKGYVIKENKEVSVQDSKMVLDRIFDVPLVLPHLLDLAYWISEYYICNLSQALATVIPPEIRNIDVKYDGTLKVKVPKTRRKKKKKGYAGYIPLSDYETPLPGEYRNLLVKLPIEERLSVYLKLIEKERDNGKGVVVLFPEVDTLLAVEDKFRKEYEGDIAMLYSGQSPAVKNEEWWRIRYGKVKIVLGTRSAIFAPLENLGLIIIDGEESDSYKDESRPLYDARTIAYRIQELLGCKVIFGSSTPSLDTYKRVTENRINIITEDRTRDLSNIKSVNMKGRRGFLSRELIHYCKVSLARKKQILILVNRKGYFTLEVCKNCGYIERCPNCNIALVYHKDEGLECHYCGYSIDKMDQCPECGGKMELFGYGVERIEEILQKIFPKAKIARMDADLPTKEINEIWERFINGNIDILVGTQMIAKGFRLPNVALTGILASDLALNLPDFKVSERIFQLIYSLAEQTGNNKYLVIQSMLPSYYPIKYASRLDYESFYRYESQLRRSLGYPPYSHMVRIVISGKDEESVKTIASSLALDIKRRLRIDYSGPARCPLYRIKKTFHWHILLKIKDLTVDIMKVVKELVGAYNYKDIGIMVDVDPVSML